MLQVLVLMYYKQFEEEAVKRINNLDAISVREANAKKLISNKIHKNIQIVLDPVLLIEPDEWMKIVKKPVEEKYMLAYILGNSNQSRIISQDAPIYERKVNNNSIYRRLQ